MNKKRWIGGLIALGVVAAVTIGLSLRHRFDGAINAAGVDLSQPDAYVFTPALSRLPRDIVRAPVARDLLTEDFAFYYEEHEDRLGLRGAVKRIAFEHRTTLADDLLTQVLDEPAELAMWADAKGAPRRWLLAMTRGTVARAVQQLATLAADDRQLSVIGPVRFNGSDATVYALSLSPRRTLGLVSQGNRVVVLSDPGLLFGDERKADPRSADVVARLLSGDAGEQGVYRRALGLGAPGADHQLVAHARLLSFGYQHFFPGLQALRLDVAPGGGTVQTRLRVAGAAALPAAPSGRTLWQAMPANPAACTLLPADWTRVKAVVSDAPGRPEGAAGQAWQALADQLDGPAAICWYPRSQLHTPLVVVRTRDDGAAADAALESLSAWLFPAAAKPVDAAASSAGARRWQREVAAPWGTQGEGDDAAYHASLARQGRWISFSPDAALVDLAVEAQARRYPSVADAWPEQAAVLAVIAPRAVADLAQTEAFAVLPPDQALFRQAVAQHLVPRLDALRKIPAARAVPRGVPDAGGWTSIDWAPVPALAASAGRVSPCPRRGSAVGPGLRRRAWLTACAAMATLAILPDAQATDANPALRLDREQSQRFRDWMTLLIHEQLERGPTPRWTHRDCAGLVRFSAAEALRSHDVTWKRANGLLGTRLPPDLSPEVAAPLRNAWRRADGSRDAYVGALELVQENTHRLARHLAPAAPADLLFYDFGDDQHLMVFMGPYIAYHTGHLQPDDNGLRAVRPAQLQAWQDTRWRPAADNPNFAGVYRFDFLAA